MYWIPNEDILKNSNIYKMMQQHHFTQYSDFWKWSVSNKKEFWSETISNLNISFKTPFSEVCNLQDVENPEWLKDAQFNIVDSCFQNEQDATAIIYQEENGSLQKISQKQLEQLVNKIANSLYNAGLVKGDVIAVDMPMTLEAVAIYLAAIKAGISVATVADSFTPNEIAVRLKITKPKLIFTQDFLLRAGKKLPLYEKVVEANAPRAIIIKVTKDLEHVREDDLFWDDFLIDKTIFNSVIQNPKDVITILFSSGTTGEPKAIPWTHTTPIKSASDGYYHHNIKKNDVVCWPTNLGWMMGPWLIFSALINKASIALFYGAPIDRNFGEFVQNAKVTMLGVVPSIVKHWVRTRCIENLDWSAIKCFSSTGEASNPKEMEYLMQLGNHKPIIEYCGGTEIGGGYITSTVVQENIPSTFSTQALGGEFVLMDSDNKPTDSGELFLIPPIIGLSETLLNRNHHDVYYKGTPTYKGQKLRRHGDRLVRLENGYYKAMGRVDDAMNLGGIKVSSVQIEAVVNSLNFVKESAAIAVSPKDGGPSNLIIFYVNNESKEESKDEDLSFLSMINTVIKKELNPLFKAAELIKIDKLPRTASGKVMRRTLRDLYTRNS